MIFSKSSIFQAKSYSQDGCLALVVQSLGAQAPVAPVLTAPLWTESMGLDNADVSYESQTMRCVYFECDF